MGFTEFRALPFRGDRLDMTVKIVPIGLKDDLAIYRFRGDELDITD